MILTLSMDDKLVAEALKSAAAFGEIHSIAVEAVQAKV